MANYKEDIINIELESGNIHRSFLRHSIGEGDALANRFGVRVFRGKEPVQLEGTCTGYFIRADGTTVPVQDGVVSGNLAYVTLNETCYAVEGIFSLAIKITRGSEKVTLRIVDGMVCRTATDTAADPGNIIHGIEDLIEAIDNAVDSIPADYSALSTAVKWSLGDTYPPYDAIALQAAYIETTVQGKLDGDGFWEDDPYYVIHKIPVTPGELLLVKAGSYYNTWQFMNSAYIPSAATVDSKIYGQPARYNNQDVFIVVPDGAKYLMIVDTATSENIYVYLAGNDYKTTKNDTVISSNNLVSGSYSGNISTWIYSFERLRTVSPVRIAQDEIICGSVPNGYTLIMCFFRKTGETISEYSVTGEYSYNPPVNAYYFIPVIKKTNGGNIYPADVNGIVIKTTKGYNQLRKANGNICKKIVGERKYVELTGTVETSPSGQWDRTEMFDVKPEVTYLASAFSRKDKIPSNIYLAFYDENEGFIGSQQLIDTDTFTTPAKCHHMIVSGDIADIEYMYISESSDVPMVYKEYGYNGIEGKDRNNTIPAIISYAKNGLNYYGEYAVPIYPHGSVYAFIGAKYAGFDYALIDVIMTTDGKFVVSHSDDLSDIAKNDDGTSLGTFKISEHTLAEVKAVDMGYDYGERYRHTRIQTLEEILQVVKSLSMGIVVEPELDPIGSTNYTTLVNIIKSYGFTSDCIMFSYIKSELEIAKGIIPNVGLMLYCGNTSQIDQNIANAISLVDDNNKVYINDFANRTGTYANKLTQGQIENMIANNVMYCVSTPDSEPSGFIDFMENATHAWYASLFGTVAYPAWKMCADNIPV